MSFLQNAELVHGNKYDYTKIVYINIQTKVEIICSAHGSFWQTPSCHIRGKGQGCPKCAIDNKPRISCETFIDRANATHNNRYDYSLIDHSIRFNITVKHPIICPVHGTFHQRGNDHVNGHKCPKCKPIAFSRKALTWLDHIIETENLQINHAGNGGEFRIPSTQMSADGYCSTTNTIYEFDGDAFHGNLARYKPTDYCNPYNKTLTADMLYQATIKKHQRIRDLGYNLVTIWESDYDKLNLQLTTKYSDITISKLDTTYVDQLFACGLEIVGEYTGAKEYHDLKCLKCGSIHTATPISKIWCVKRHPDNFGCPKCNKVTTDTKNKQRGNYEARLLALNYTVAEYQNAGIRCLLTCIKCGKQKKVFPNPVIQRNKPCCS